MLYLIKGSAGSGKTGYMRNIIKKTVCDNKYKPLLIVPEQFSFESERIMLSFLGAKAFKELSIYSFSRLSHSILKNTSLINKKIPDNGVRLALMSRAIKELEGNLNIFNKSKNNTATLESLVDLSKELKFCKISAFDIEAATQNLSAGFLKDKLSEINLINEGYNALVEQSYFDDTSELDLLCEYALKENIFNDKVVFIDGFRDFSKQEFQLFSIMLSQAKDVYVTLCINEKPVKYSAFYFIKKFETALKTCANNSNTTVNEIILRENSKSFSEDIFFVEQSIYSENISEKIPSDGSVTVCECVDIDDECRFVATQIKKLLRSGDYRCKDIAVIERVNGTYKNILTEELKKLGVPVFEDSRRSLSFETLFVYLNALLMCITGNLNSENIFTYLKTGFSPLSVGEVAALEKYALVWGVGAKGWSQGFTAHPDGFGKEFNDKAQARLAEINSLREKVIGPVLKLKADCKEKNGGEITKLIYEFLVKENIQDKLYSLYESLLNDGFPVEANRQSVSWDRLMHLLDCINDLTNDNIISLEEWYDVYKILVSAEEIGEIPQGLDEITIGSADRIRTEKKKVSFLLGVNKDEFPLVNVKNGILTDDDRVSLTDLGLNIRPAFKDTVDEERFITYCALTSASEKLYLSYKTVDGSGGELFNSEIIDTIRLVLPQIKELKTKELPADFFVESEDSAFSVLCENYNSHNVIFSTLMEYFKNNEIYTEKINAINCLIGKKNFDFNNQNLSTELFSENLKLSASKVETYYKCPFAYFMRYGLNAEPVKAAELDPSQSGIVVHYVMENVLKKYPKCEFVSASNEEIKDVVKTALNEYIQDKMGGIDDKSARFMFLYNRLLDVCMIIIERLKQEFSLGLFEPCGFEVYIGDENIKPYEISLEKGVAQIRGYIDRVDMMEKDGIKYLRVIDYKTGTKDFNLSEVMDGLNIQMILYLMALEKNGKNIYGDFIPSAVLYLPSKIGVSKYLKRRNPEIEEINHTKKISGKLSGMILGSPVVFNGMGIAENPDYFPAKYNAKNELTGNIYSQSDFKNISSHIDGKIKEMGDSLHNGKVNAIPLGKNNEGKMCVYCSYKSICGYETGDEVKEAFDCKHNEALKAIGGGENE